LKQAQHGRFLTGACQRLADESTEYLRSLTGSTSRKKPELVMAGFMAPGRALDLVLERAHRPASGHTDTLVRGTGIFGIDVMRRTDSQNMLDTRAVSMQIYRATIHCPHRKRLPMLRLSEATGAGGQTLPTAFSEITAAETYIQKREDRVQMLKEVQARIKHRHRWIVSLWVDGNFRAWRYKLNQERKMREYAEPRWPR
jgi:hypothetical protein